MSRLLRFAPALIALALFLPAVAGSRASASLEPMPLPAATPEPPPWYSPEVIDAATKKLEDQKATLGTEMGLLVETFRANGEEQTKLAEQAGPINEQLKKADSAITATEAELTAHSGRCHNGQLEQSAYNSCLGEHSTIVSKYEVQVAAAKQLVVQINQLKTQWENLGAKNGENQKRWETMKQQQAKFDEQIAMLAELKSKVPSCNAFWSKCTDRSCPQFAREGLKHCYSVFWDGAQAGLPPLPDNPNLPFVATPNSGDSGDSSVVDTRGVKKMTAAEREAELKKPRASGGRSGRRGSAPPPPPEP